MSIYTHKYYIYIYIYIYIMKLKFPINVYLFNEFIYSNLN